MKSRVFKNGSYIWECKSSYTDPGGGGAINVAYLKGEIEDIENRWLIDGKPSGYYYVFPVNLVSNDARRELDRFIKSYRGEVDINYYDRDDIQKIIKKLEKLSDMQSLVDYIKLIWMG
jgi:hypothetical protein